MHRLKWVETQTMPKLQYKQYILGLLTVVAAFNYLDRYVLSLVLESIKQDLQLSDGQLGLLTGFAFALFYAVAGIPIARWADRGNRNTVVTLTTALWSAMVALCGLVGNYTQLLLVRVGVAVGEAGCLPPGQSLIADYFNRAERPRAMAIYSMCSPIAMIIGYLGGGWLAEKVGWRITFIIIGVPGILLAILVKLTLREPRLEQKKTTIIEQPPFKVVLNTLWQQPTFRHIVLAFCITFFFNMGIGIWLPTFFIRSHGMETGELGSWLAFVWGVCAVFGTYLGGFLATRYAAGKEGLQVQTIALAHILYGILYVTVYLSSNKYNALALLAALTIIGAAVNGPISSAIQSLVSNRMRSFALALILLFANLIGFGVGPLAAGVLSDLLAPMFGQESLRYALMLLSPGYLWAAFHYWKASHTVEVDIRQVEREAGSMQMEAAMRDANAPALSRGSA